MTLAFVGSNPAIPAISDPLAQLAEQLPFKQWVRGSNPRRVTRNHAATFVAAWFLFFFEAESIILPESPSGSAEAMRDEYLGLTVLAVPMGAQKVRIPFAKKS